MIVIIKINTKQLNLERTNFILKNQQLKSVQNRTLKLD